MTRLRRSLACAAMLALVPLDGSAIAATDRATLEQLRRGDVRLAAIGHRLATGNAVLCDDRVPAIGLVVHAIDQYSADEQGDARAVFGFDTAVAIEGVVPGSAAARAGIRPDESIVRVNDRPIPPADGAGHVRTRDSFVALLDAQPVDRPLRLTLRRAGRDRAVVVPPSPGCRSYFELRPGPALDASADGAQVQISGAFLDRFSDDQVAVVVAHELAHNILRHRRRLDAAGISRGVFREFGRNGRLFRATEDEADRLSVYLLRNAGWDPGLAVRFWQGPGARIAGGIFYSRTHSSPARRAELIAQEIAALPAGAPIPYRPPLLARQDAPLR
ncbi:M48 family metallopeptidase [Sphingomonas sp. Leaf25]|uniref:M48 family metallopeptidase n=1 Tax=Sphingomonas sp. Leaf25 TaxID=1735692 RepID=UPI0012E13DD5|nr:M48 family metallopeptidase [Sphingomonas sp. Leaf25]